MPKRPEKSSIIHACIIKQQLEIEDFEKEISALKKEIYSHNETPSQGDSSAAERTEVLQRYESEVGFLKEELEILQGIDPNSEISQVAPGAVVVTNQRTFFISVSIEQVEVNGQDIFGLSTKAPIFQSLRGKKVGDKFDFNGIHYEIQDVY
ncbi:hypothetical protein ACFOSV_08475 [Algoriphagus namhaensis]|uniref:Transcription elongation factor n=1 Tax=Algoriphagus namhaensis TaxID=915353 RepID=A0ABV8AQC6_9BACT